ncbi:MAG TPA: peptidyl-alpha-hydroxyglycine alpha-amidating lyase family protein [Gemmatimonadales bacterium]|jgi:DNA-binding beta-propeller fold protein YncE|nr:peptidyl-alpha-hydroxyglycine alpha-amidating lyase family protein [Gemmatimonadales bacterium]
MRLLPLLGLAAAAAPAAGQGSTPPTNDLPNPYRTIEGWAQMPEGRTWGSTSAVEIARDGISIWVAERCGSNSCAGSNLDPILQFDSTGTLVKHFGAGLFHSPHGIFVDRDGNLWVTDCSCTGTAEQRRADSLGSDGKPKGHRVFKFSPDGKLLMTLGQPGGGRDSGYFYQPNDVLVAPNGDIFVAEGHSSAAGANARILKFNKDGRLLKAFGTRGTGPGELDQPHALAMDSRGRLFVGDRSNDRIQIFDQEGKSLAVWSQFSRPSGIYIRSDTIYVSDSESGGVSAPHGNWKRGIRIGSARDGALWWLIPDPAKTEPGRTSAGEGVAVDARGTIYGAEVGAKTVRRYVKP